MEKGERLRCLGTLAAGAAEQNAATNARSSVFHLKSTLVVYLVARREVGQSDAVFLWLWWLVGFV